VALEEKHSWITAVVSLAAYAVYLVIVLGRASDVPLADVPYVAALLWSIGAAIVVAIVLSIAAAVTSPKDDRKKDVRDREIYRFGESIGQSFLAIGGVAAMAMSMAELAYFWISNVIYLMFVLSAVLSSVAKIFAYRKGFHPW
jgi:cell division protein FtsW (lipid II flippase)